MLEIVKIILKGKDCKVEKQTRLSEDKQALGSERPTANGGGCVNLRIKKVV